MVFQKMLDYIKKSQKHLKILVMGLDNAGKTTIVNGYFSIKEDSAPTFGYKSHKIHYGEWSISVVDVGGQYCFREFWRNYFEKVDGVIFVVDVTDKRSFSDYLVEVMGLDVPICLLANKTDLGGMGEIKKLEGGNLRVFGTRADEMGTVDLGIRWLLKEISGVSMAWPQV